MNCHSCGDDVDRPCKTSADCAGCYRLADKPETVNMDPTTDQLLGILAMQVRDAFITAADVGVWTANREALTRADKDRIGMIRHELHAIKMRIECMVGKR